MPRAHAHKRCYVLRTRIIFYEHLFAVNTDVLCSVWHSHSATLQARPRGLSACRITTGGPPPGCCSDEVYLLFEPGILMSAERPSPAKAIVCQCGGTTVQFRLQYTYRLGSKPRRKDFEDFIVLCGWDSWEMKRDATGKLGHERGCLRSVALLTMIIREGNLLWGTVDTEYYGLST